MPPPQVDSTRQNQPFCTRKYKTNTNTPASNVIIIFMVRSVRLFCKAKSFFSKSSSKINPFHKFYDFTQILPRFRRWNPAAGNPGITRIFVFPKTRLMLPTFPIMNYQTIFLKPVLHVFYSGITSNLPAVTRPISVFQNKHSGLTVRT